jgi:3,4-dihydroxy 2-butanone 4-phosphate synthase/GTP cyclohydrolase II
VLVRTGHTEGSVDLCKLAGVAPVGVICEIIKDDGSMARASDLEVFAQKHDLCIVYISDIVEYRLANEQLIQKIESSKIEFRDEIVKKHTYKDHLDRVHTVLEFKQLGTTSSVKFHNIGLDIDLVLDNKRFDALNNSIEYLKQNGGLLIFVDTKVISKEQAKEYGIGAQILKDLGVSHINLLTTNKDTEFVGLGGFGLDVVEKTEVL